MNKHNRFGFCLGVLTLLAAAFITFEQVHSLKFNDEGIYSQSNEQIANSQRGSVAVCGDSFGYHFVKLSESQKDLRNSGKTTFAANNLIFEKLHDEIGRITYSSRKVYTKFRKEDLLFPFQYFW